MRRLAILFRLALLLLPPVLVACSERIDSGAACPTLCPTENVPVRDTILDAVVLDSSFGGYPFPGEAPFLLLAERPGPDSLDVRTIVRFDSLPIRYFPSGATDSVAITQVDSGFLEVHFDTTSKLLSQPATIEAYDVDTTADVDTVAAALNKLFRLDRLLGSVTIDSASLTTDSLRVPISNIAIAAKTRDSLPLRIGLRIRSSASTRLRIVASQGGSATNPMRLSFDPVSPGDTTYSPIVLTPTSATPAGDAATSLGMRDFTIVAAGAVPAVGTDLVVGGLPAHRVLMRFDVPPALVDSASIVRAALLLTQLPAPGAEQGDTVQLNTNVVVAQQNITDLQRSIDLSAPGKSFGVDSVRLSPADSGARTVSLVSLVRAWHVLPAGTQRAIVFSAEFEGAQASALRFVSTEGPLAFRPKLRISYIPRTEFALP